LAVAGTTGIAGGKAPRRLLHLQKGKTMIFYIIGVIVVVLVVASFLGVHI
jgi:hypothetical protein